MLICLSIILAIASVSARSISAPHWGLDGKNILVTGGTKGIGKAVVEECCALGASVFTCSRNKEELEACLREWKAAGCKVHGCCADLSTAAGRESLLSSVQTAFQTGSGGGEGGLHCLVNNVGFNIRKRVVDFTEDDYNAIMRTNLQSAYELAKSLHPELKKSKSGASIVNIGSVAGTVSGSLSSAATHMLPMLNNIRFSYCIA